MKMPMPFKGGSLEVGMEKQIWAVLLWWRECLSRRCSSFLGLGSPALFLVFWSCFLSFTSISCLIYVLLGMGAAGTAVHFLGLTPGLSIVGIFAIFVWWMYANFWITGTLFIVGGSLFSFNHARLLVLIATIYALYRVKVQDGWLGVFVAINVAFLSDDILKYLIHWCDNLSESTHVEEPKDSESFTDDFSTDFEYSIPTDEEKCKSPRSSSTPITPKKLCIKPIVSVAKVVVREDGHSAVEMERILSSDNHYEALGLQRHQKIDHASLKKEYRKKAMLVHPDKNMGSPMASDSFKKLQCAYEVLSDVVKKKDYDDQLRKEESKTIAQKVPGTFHQESSDYCFEESKRIQCTKCQNSHIWICTNRSKIKARWCQDCSQYHQAQDGDGWVEYMGSLTINSPQKAKIPRAFVCVENKIFDASEWAICQGIACRPNAHRPSFHVNYVGLEKSAQRFNSSTYPRDLGEETLDGEEEQLELWLQHALASGLFRETSKRTKTWRLFKLNLRKGIWRRSS